MTSRITTLASALVFGLVLASGSAFAGSGKSCGGNKDKGDDGTSAAVVLPSMPQA